MKGLLSAAVSAAAMLAAVPVSAETLRVNGIYPAGNDSAVLLDSIAIEPFGGEDGGSLSIRVEDALRAAQVDGEAWFRILPGSLSTDAEAALRGTVVTRIDRESAGDKEVKRCVERDEKRKCVREIKNRVPCMRTVVRVSPSLRLIDREGALMHADDSTVERSERFCADDNRPDSEAMVDSAIDEIASRVRYELAPTQRSEAIRVLESRKGMDKALGRQFRDAIRQTKVDEPGACESFAALEPGIGAHESLLFNMGLCAEAAGDLDTAETYYNRAIALDGSSSHAEAGLRRIGDRRVALRQLSEKYGG